MRSHRREVCSRPAVGLPTPSLEPTDLLGWRRARLDQTTRPSLSRATSRSAAGVSAEGEVKRRGRVLAGAVLPTERLQSLSGHCVALEDLCVGWLIVYCFPGLHFGDEESRREDARDHHAYARCFTRLERCGIRLASLSSAPRELQTQAMLEHGLAHSVLLDPDLLIADALGLPMLCEDGRRAYSRLALVARCGVIEHVFYPARGGRSAEQAVTWMQVHAGPESLDAG